MISNKFLLNIKRSFVPPLLLSIIFIGLFLYAPKSVKAAVPTSPYSPGLISRTGFSLYIYWNADDPDDTNTNFLIDYSTDQITWNEVDTITKVGAYSLESLDIGTNYYIKIKAVNPDGQSDFSEIFQFATVALPAAPTNFASDVQSGTTAAIYWDAVDPDGDVITSYLVDYSTNQNSWTEVDSMSMEKAYFFENLSPGTTYFYKVKARSSLGDSNFSETNSFTTFSLPAAPTDLSSNSVMVNTAIVNFSYILNISAPVFLGHGYISTDNIAWVELPYGICSDTGCNLDNLAENTKYYFKAKVENSVGLSTFSETISFTTLPPFINNGSDPEVFQSSVDKGAIFIQSGNILDTDIVVFEVGYTIVSNGATITFPQYTQMRGSQGENYSLLNFVTRINTSEITSEIDGVTNSIKVGIPNFGLVFSNNITISIPVDNSFNGTQLTVYYQTEGSSDWHIQATCLVANGLCEFQTDHATTFAVIDPNHPATPQNTTNQQNIVADATYSSNSIFTCSATAPTTPNLFQIDVTDKNAKLFFTPLSNTNQFYISYSTNTNAEEHGVSINLAREGVQNYSINALKPNTTYYFKVRGQNDCATGEWSNILKVRTKSSRAARTTAFYPSTAISKLISKIANVKPSTIKPSIVKPETVLDSPAPVQTTSPSPSNDIPKVRKSSFCFLWWCF